AERESRRKEKAPFGSLLEDLVAHDIPEVELVFRLDVFVLGDEPEANEISRTAFPLRHALAVNEERRLQVSARDTGLHGNGEMFLRREKGAAAHGQRGTALRPHARGFDCLESVGSEPFSARSEQPSPKFPASPEVQAVETGNQPEVINDPAPEIASFHEVEIRSDRSRRSSLGGGSRKNQRKRETVTHEVFLLFSGERSRRLMRSCRDEGFLY